MLFLDMDGVLMDFEGSIAKRIPTWTGRTYIHLPESEWTKEEAANDELYKAAMNDPDFWPSLEPLGDAHELWSFCRPYHPHILSAVPNKTANRRLVEHDKRASIWRCFDSTFPNERIHLCLRSEKQLWARPGHILVDDSYANCEEWHKAGGTAILHKDAKSTIKQLQEIIGAYV